MSGQIMWGKFALFTTAIMATGWGVMRLSTPTEQQFYDSLAPDLQRKVDEVRAQREGSNRVRDQLATAGMQDQVVWGDQLAPAGGAMKPPPQGRKV